MKYLVCLPYVYKPYYEACLATLKIPGENIYVIDNTEINLGIMHSHNLGLELMKERKDDWLIILSAAVRFGEAGGLDFLKEIEKNQDYHVINGMGHVVLGGEEKYMAVGWHLSAFRKDVFERVGNWDENFTPYGFDDVDLTIRMQKGFGKDFKMATVPVDCRHESTSHSIQIANVHAPSTPRINYFQRKWGKHPGEWQVAGYATPFNDPKNDLSYWPNPHGQLGIKAVEMAALGGDKNVGE